MTPTDLAKEVAAFNVLRDRPSTLAIELTPWSRGSLKVIAPVVNGRTILRVIFPQRQLFAVDYDIGSVEAFAFLIASNMRASNRREEHLFYLCAEHDRAGGVLTCWRFYCEPNDDDTKRAVLIQEIKQILSLLFTI
jgi:hypothetical protein